MGTPLCHIDDIPDPGGRGFTFGAGTERWEVFVIRRGGEVHAYENTCPHTGTPLETLPDRFLTADQSLILCSTHGARFRIDDGYCVAGPCEGRRLTPVAVDLAATGQLSLDEPGN
ncbi:MAG: Rieske (2Fe-2S) protein [Alphaproteobacteria bacterium]|nr:Rieske (2Fe-2S) protein [Alphaproteobacteria bacterium]